MKFLLTLLISLLWSTHSYAVFNFDVSICTTGCDYSLWSTAENALDNASDIRETGTAKCGAWDAQSGSIADAAAVTWDSGASSGTLHHMTDAGAAGEYYVTVSVGTLDDNDIISDGTNTITVAGAPDSCSLTLYCNASNEKLNDTVSFQGLTTDADNNYTVTSASAFRHTGTAATGCGINRTVATENAVSINQSNTIFEWLTLKSTHDSGSLPGACLIIPNSGQTGLIVRNNIVYECTNTNTPKMNGIRAIPGTAFGSILNNFVYEVEGQGIGGSNSTATGVIKNNTAYSSGSEGIGFGNGTWTCINNLSLSDSVSADYVGCDTLTTSGASDTTGTLDNLVWTGLFVNITVGSEDLHILSDGSGVIDGGTAQGTTDGVQFDIDNYDRDTMGVTWDMGADEFVASVAADPAISGTSISGTSISGM